MVGGWERGPCRSALDTSFASEGHLAKEEGVARSVRCGLVAVWLGLACTCLADVIRAVATPRVILKRLVLDDFEAPPGAREYGTLDQTLPAKARGRIQWEPERCRRSRAGGRCMRIEYEFGAGHPMQASFAIDLGDLDASAYDHVEIWIKGDERSGYSPALKIGFRRPKAELPRLMEDGTAVITGITGSWQRIVVPLNRMAGIEE